MSASESLITAAVRSAAPRAVAALVRRTGDLDAAEDAVQDALLDAARQWPGGLPDDPVAWLVAVAGRRYVDAVRSEVARREREARVASLEGAPAAVSSRDDTLDLFLLCCHPSLSRASQLALTLRAVGGLTTREIARGLLASEKTVAQRISRAKATIRDAGGRLGEAPTEGLAQRMRSVLDVLGLLHTESHSATAGDEIRRPALAAETTRLTRMLLARTTEDAPWRGEAMGLLALVLLTDARDPARRDAGGRLVALADQDRSLWRRDAIAEGIALLEETLPRHRPGPFQLRAAIAAVHDEAATAADTDWRQLLALYAVLRRIAPSPLVDVARAVVIGEVDGANAGLAALAAVRGAPELRMRAARAHLLARGGRLAEARDDYAAAAVLSTNGAERRWFEERAAGRSGESP